MVEMVLTLKACRINCNLKIKEVAELVGRTDRTVKNWESGRSIPNGQDLKKLSAIYRVDIDHIFLGDTVSLKAFYKQKVSL
ncbi:MAG: helix-turn-helix transcriptional regulator [Breznakia sp.]